MAADPTPDWSEALDETRFTLRADALDFLAGTDDPIILRLEAIDAGLFRRLRAELGSVSDKPAALRTMIDRYIGVTPSNGSIGYDHLDAFVNGLLHPDPVPDPGRPLEAEMVPFQKTPARIVLELIDRARPAPEDVFYDLGSGLGQIPILMHLLTGAVAKGIEVEPAYVAYARACAGALNLAGTEFLAVDARDATFADATLVFLYTPFHGTILDAVLTRLLRDARPGLRLFSFGPCTAHLARFPGLRRLDGNADVSPHRLALFGN